MTGVHDQFTIRKAKAVETIFHAAGAALFKCQHFELSLVYYLFCMSHLEGSKLDAQEIVDILNNKKKMTAGPLIEKLKKHVRMSGQMPIIFAEALNARNRIVHSLLVQSTPKFSSVKGRGEVIQEIRLLTAKVHAANETLAPFIEKVSADLDGDRIREMMAEYQNNFE